jgi:hypothetical protein
MISRTERDRFVLRLRCYYWLGKGLQRQDGQQQQIENETRPRNRVLEHGEFEEGCRLSLCAVSYYGARPRAFSGPGEVEEDMVIEALY